MGSQLFLGYTRVASGDWQYVSYLSAPKVLTSFSCARVRLMERRTLSIPVTLAFLGNSHACRLAPAFLAD